MGDFIRTLGAVDFCLFEVVEQLKNGLCYRKYTFHLFSLATNTFGIQRTHLRYNVTEKLGSYYLSVAAV